MNMKLRNKFSAILHLNIVECLTKNGEIENENMEI